MGVLHTRLKWGFPKRVPLTIRQQSKGDHTHTQTDDVGLERSTKVTFRDIQRIVVLVILQLKVTNASTVFKP